MQLKSALESILFLSGEPIAVRRLAKLTGAKPSAVAEALAELQRDYRERGIVLIQNADAWQFTTHPHNRDIAAKLIASELGGELSRAAAEVLSIIGYRGPISRAKIDFIRGVDSSFTLRTLLLRGLVLREENPEDRRSYLYRVSADFLKHLGIQRLEELPRYAELRAAEIPMPAGEPAPLAAPPGANAEPRL